MCARPFSPLNPNLNHNLFLVIRRGLRHWRPISEKIRYGALDFRGGILGTTDWMFSNFYARL
jgi:hypothetical protein